MRRQRNLIVGKEEAIPVGAVFQRSKYYFIVGNSDENGMINYCSIDRFAFASERLKYNDGIEHLTIQESPFYFSRQHINWIRNYLNNNEAKNLSKIEIDNLKQDLDVAARDGLKKDVKKLIEICSEKKI
ncbi:MAG: hypothetical protein WC584_00570 [Candidatus Pacearchaeota archaeon]